MMKITLKMNPQWVIEMHTPITKIVAKYYQEEDMKQIPDTMQY